MQKKYKKIFIFSGEDIQKIGKDKILDIYKKKYDLLAIDVQAFSFALRQSLRCMLIEDWISLDKQSSIAEQANELNKTWYFNDIEKLTIDGICLPEVDRNSLHWFWQEILLTKYLFKVLHEAGYKKILCTSGRNKRKSIGHSPADVYPSVLVSMASDSTIKVNVLCFFNSILSLLKSIKCIKMLFRKLKYILYRVNQIDLLNYNKLTHYNSHILSCASFEIFRFSSIVQEFHSICFDSLKVVGLAGVRGKEFQQIYKKITKKHLRKNKKLYLKTFDGPKLIKKYDTAHISMAAEKALNNTLFDLGLHNINPLFFQIKYYAYTRLPFLINSYFSWVKWCSDFSPISVTVSSLEYTESQLPALAAKRTGIRTFSIPHGGFSPANLLQQANYICCSSKLQALVWEDVGIESSRIYKCRGLVAKEEYPSFPVERNDELKLVSILVLCDPITPLTHRLLPRRSIREQVKTIQEIINIPDDMKTHVSIKVKTHPGYPETELFRLGVEGNDVSIVDKNADLHELLNSSDLVVAMNYLGTALIHAVKSGKPIILYWPNLNAMSFDRSELKSQTHYWQNCGLLVKERQDFWPLVQKLIHDEQYYEKARINTLNWYQKYIQDDDLPTLAEIIKGFGN